MTDYVLVHGAWGGAFTWKPVADGLRAAGHRVLAPDLPGLGERRGELHGGITLSDHVADVEAKIAQAGFERLVLAGHSYGGMVITALATQLGARIDALPIATRSCPATGKPGGTSSAIGSIAPSSPTSASRRGSSRRFSTVCRPIGVIRCSR